MTVLSFPEEIISAPVFYALRQGLIPHQFEIKILPEKEIEQLLQQNEAVLGLLSPAAYARITSSLRVIKDFAILSEQASSNVLLFFKENLAGMDLIYYKENNKDTFESFIARIVMREVFETDAVWEPIPGESEAEDLLESFPALLLTGEKAFAGSIKKSSFIDLAEEWSLKVQLPLFNRILVASNRFTDSGELETLRLSLELGMRNFKKIAVNHAKSHFPQWSFYHDLLTRSFRYFPQEKDWDGLRLLLKYLFYYGETEYPPELSFYE
ncbi:MAG: MqnA/MqnD/SBP family protein [Calditrichia bacterium]